MRQRLMSPWVLWGALVAGYLLTCVGRWYNTGIWEAPGLPIILLLAAAFAWVLGKHKPPKGKK